MWRANLGDMSKKRGTHPSSILSNLACNWSVSDSKEHNHDHINKNKTTLLIMTTTRLKYHCKCSIQMAWSHMIPMSPMTVTKHPYLLDLGGSRGDDLWVSPQLLARFVNVADALIGPLAPSHGGGSLRGGSAEALGMSRLALDDRSGRGDLNWVKQDVSTCFKLL